MASTTTWFISGCTRGIGRGLVQEVLKRSQTIVFAGVRDPSAEAATTLQTLNKGPGSKLILIKLDVTNETDYKAAVKTIRAEGIEHLDVVIANAGIGSGYGPTLDKPMSEFHETFEANTLGPILMFQATEPLLSQAQNPRFFVSTSLIGSLEVAADIPAPALAYGLSKAGVNYFLRKVHGEFPGITFVPIHPGLVETDMGTPFAERTGMKAISVDQSVKGYLQQVDNATRETAGGKFVDYAGEVQPL